MGFFSKGGGGDRGRRRGGWGGEGSSPAPDAKEQAEDLIDFERSIEWEPDKEYDSQMSRMKEAAKRLRCELAADVIIAMFSIMDKGTHPGNIYRGPTEAEIAAGKRGGRRSRMGEEGLDRRDGLEDKWRNAHPAYIEMELPEFKNSGSDWARAVGVFRAAIAPGVEGVNGVLDVSPYNSAGELLRQGDDGYDQWSKFAVWCRDHRLGAHSLWSVAQALKEKGAKPSDRDAIIAELGQLTKQQLDGVVLAAFTNPKDLAINNPGFGYKSLEATLRGIGETSGETVEERAHKAGTAASEKVLEETGWGRYADTSRRRITEVAARHKASEAYDKAYGQVVEAARSGEQGIEPMFASALFSAGDKTAAVIMRTGTTNHFGHPQKVGFGAHPVSSEVVAAIVGPENIHRNGPHLTFDFKLGQVVNKTLLHVGGRDGVILSEENKPVQNEEAVGVLVDTIMEWPAGLEYLSFHTVNKDLLSPRNLGEWAIRSGSRLAEDIDLKNWYKAKLVALGNLTSLAEVKAHANDLTLAPTDIFPGQEDIIRETERNFPKTITIGTAEFHVEYDQRYNEKSVLVPNPKVQVKNAKQEQEILKLSGDSVYVGPAAEPVPVSFSLTRALGATPQTADLKALQETIDLPNRVKAWESYAEKNKTWRKTIEWGEAIPDPAAVVSEDLQPYYSCQNGEMLYPVKAAVKFANDSDKPVIVYGLQRTAEDAIASAHRVKIYYDNALATRQRLETMDQGEAEAIRADVASLIQQLTDGENMYLRKTWPSTDSTLSALRSIEGSLAEGKLDAAKRGLEKAKETAETHFLKPWRLFQEALRLQERLEMLAATKQYGHSKPSAERNRDMFDPMSYSGAGRRSYPTAEALESIIEVMRGNIREEEGLPEK